MILETAELLHDKIPKKKRIQALECLGSSHDPKIKNNTKTQLVAADKRIELKNEIKIIISLN